MQKAQNRHGLQQLHLWPCGFLEKQFYRRGGLAELFDTPWDDKPRVVYFHSDECEDAYCRSGSFDYIQCESCSRLVCEQNPANGWHIQFRAHADLGYICLRCYETEILSNGQPRIDFEGHSIRGGMFFSRHNIEAVQAGFEEVAEFKNYLVQNSGSARRYNEHALSLLDDGNKVITGYEALAYGASEGYITMLAKAGELEN